MENLPIYISVLFIATTILSLWFFHKAAGNSRLVLIISICWLALQGTIAAAGFYLIEDGIPPRFALLMLPIILSIIIVFNVRKGKRFIDSLDGKYLAWLNIVRVPVEIVLYLLAVHKLVPLLMTFEGFNYDIISGITAPLIAYFGYTKHKFNRGILLGWNIICLLLLLNIVTIAMLSAPFQFQQLAFDQPNVGVLYFPYIWLPGFIVPLVLVSHLSMMRQILLQKQNPG